MEKWNLVGWQHSEFDTKDGNHIVGTTLYVQREDRRTTGVQCDHFFGTDRKMTFTEAEISLGMPLYVSFNRWGKPGYISDKEF